MGGAIGRPQNYSVAARIFHWVTVPWVLTLFGLGLWMGELTYYDAWYQKAPRWHIGWGFFLAVFVACRLTYRASTRYPEPLPTHAPYERWLAGVGHWMLYGLMVAMFLTGYLIETAEGEGLVVFDWFAVPSLFNFRENLQDLAGEVHEVLAFTLIALVGGHAAAALKHHFIDGDTTLRRMTLGSVKPPVQGE